MPVEVILPKVDMDMATGRISKWFFGNDASVKKGDVLFEIETDKAAMEIDAPASGILRNITGQEGVDIPVGAAVAWIYEEGEADTGVPEPEKANSPAPPSAVGSNTSVPSQSATLEVTKPAAEKVRATPLPDVSQVMLGSICLSLRVQAPTGGSRAPISLIIERMRKRLR